ncbi:MAG TPA: 4-amino-4-deoxy-L-arabinose-phospho-UDP flippase [Gammaproteobacteria bacterium]|nr:4-amino-4-deoxy-L-arabinose-phospho-UDP flippase [Gammaproteobacteria bacterium]
MSADAKGRWLGRALLASSIVLSAAGQLGMKAGMQELHALTARGGALAAASWSDLAPVIGWTFAGLSAYGLSLVCWLAVLVRYPLSYAYPLLGLAYVLVYAGATLWPRLAEPASVLRTGGTLLILAGVALVTLADRRR